MDTIIVASVIAVWVLLLLPAVVLPAFWADRGRLDLRPGSATTSARVVPLGTAHEAAPTNAAA